MKKMLFEERFFTISSEIWRKVAEIDGINGQWVGGLNLSPQMLGRLKKSVLITSSGASTRIEGANLSDEEVETLMAKITIQKFVDRDSQEVRGYYELLQVMFDSWETTVFNESMMKHFHKELLKYVEKDVHHRGEYKKGENRVEMFDENGKSVGIIFQTMPAYLTPKATQELVDWTIVALEEKRFHSLFIIANFIVEFLRIHPFQDGNGRLSRVLTNFFLLKCGYAFVPYVSHEKLIEDNKDKYYIALRRSQKSFGSKKEDIVPWLEFFLDILLKQGEIALSLMSNEQVEKILSPKQLLIWEYFQNVSETTPSEIVAGTAVARPTVNQSLLRLINLKKIEKIGAGRGTRYRKL